MLDRREDLGLFFSFFYDSLQMMKSLSVQLFDQRTKKKNNKNEGSIPDNDIMLSIIVNVQNYGEVGKLWLSSVEMLFPSFRIQKGMKKDTVFVVVL